MKIAFLAFFIICCTVVYSQSKKELINENAGLKSKVDALEKELVALKASKSVDMEDRHQKASYALGVLMGSSVRMQAGDSLDLDGIYSGMQDALVKDSPALDPQECNMIVQQYVMKVKEQKDKYMKEAGQEFLEENKKKEGVKTTSSGLQYLVVKAVESGKSPTATDSVTVHYTGMLIDGTVFDSSLDRGQPITFPLNQVIPGWTEGVQLMKEGEKFTFYIPYHLGYGERGAGGDIPPYSALIFDVELIRVAK